MKKFISILIAIMMVLALGVAFVGCKDDKGEPEETTAEEVVETVEDTVEETVEDTGAESVEDTFADTTPETDATTAAG